eukprot:CAMPEP_0119418916 /NCGR_PEP_ID=MMETSP1335-20130426/19467_1 /TAXON_ID=259385 /ORGANISM="Chrysoculter rhomboideus, Strain RCC1486" /LENGTH=225 /DNA_ID=CAMNT_0007444189 /DNA_START=104 /DNA_END=782 /DNA_ORIENTATION=-
MASGLIWTVIPPMRSYLVVLAIYSTGIQELGRYGMYVAYVRLQKMIAAMRGISSHSLDYALSPSHAFTERVACATAIGVGIGATHALLLTGRQLSDASSPGSSYVEGCVLSQYGLSALVALAFALLHVLWTVYAFIEAYPRESPSAICLIIASHLAASGLTLLHSVSGQLTLQCGGLTLPLLYALLISLCGVTARSAISTSESMGAQSPDSSSDSMDSMRQSESH